ncbi:MAG: hypothetical protein KC635_16475 [Myxococcales bacterium]|nr:hypothetical protein [Myxococcales bacterium]MCB9731004.1 hypothetical protein [Deltaproteobacteria bacterium]
MSDQDAGAQPGTLVFFALLLDGRVAHTAGVVVRADTHAERGDAVVFLRDGAVVHQVPAAFVVAIEPHPDDKAARDAVLRHRQRGVGGATVHVREGATAAPRGRSGVTGTAIPAEGLSIRVSER